MAQMDQFELSDRSASLNAKKDPLIGIDTVVPWGNFRPLPERVWRTPMDGVLMLRTLVLSALYSLSGDQIGYQLRDRLSFMCCPAFAACSDERAVPGAGPCGSGA